MVNTIDMQDLRYLNLFEKITRVRTRHCIKYNNALIFCVPEKLMAKAIGENGKNVKKMQGILNRNIKIVPIPDGIEDAEKFIESIVSPITIKNVEVNENEIVVSGGKNKAVLIGRNKRRLNEMQKILESFFKKDYRVA